MSPEPASSKSLTSQKRNGKEFLCENKLKTENDFSPYTMPCPFSSQDTQVEFRTASVRASTFYYHLQ